MAIYTHGQHPHIAWFTFHSMWYKGRGYTQGLVGCVLPMHGEVWKRGRGAIPLDHMGTRPRGRGYVGMRACAGHGGCLPPPGVP